MAYTDTAMQGRHQAFGFRAQSLYLPHAANGRLLPAPDTPPPGSDRDLGLVFVANPTPGRRAIIAAMTHGVSLFGPGWAAAGPHRVDPRLIGVAELGRLYAASAAVLNIRNEGNVTDGLNQRHFDPGLFGVPVLSDPQPDLARCFEPGQEVLVWSDAAELNALHERLLREPAWGRDIGARARLRVMADHLYGHRLRSLRQAM